MCAAFRKGIWRKVPVFVVGLAWSLAGVADLDIPDTPLFLTSVGVRPNIVLTLDDSGSMRRAFVPEVCGDSSDCSALDNRWAKSSHANALYYDPTVTYDPPLKADGTAYSTSFSQAWRNGFYTLGTRGGFNYASPVDLSEDYRPNANVDMGSSDSQDFMGHYASDVRCGFRSGPDPCQYNSTAGTGTATWVNMESPFVDCDSNSECRSRTMPAYYYVFDDSNSGCTGTADQKKRDNDCYDIRIVSSTSGPGGSDERQNFANWYSFYRTRSFTAVSGASLAFAGLDAESRVAWQALNSCRGSQTNLTTSNCRGWTGDFGSNAIGYFAGTKKSNFYDWLARVPTSSGTPLRQAMTRVGEYYATSAPYANDLDGIGSSAYSCRKNYHVMMTDGIWNDSTSSISLVPANTDNTAIAHLPDAGDDNPIDLAGTPYDTSASYADIFKDNYSKTLADVAFKYWSTDLRPTLTNDLSQYLAVTSGTDVENFWNPRNDPATWQHMVNYTIGLGLTDFLAAAGLTWGGDTYSGSYTAIADGTLAWPQAAEFMGDPGSNYGRSVPDLWHAAINSRGQFYSAESPDQMVTAFQEILDTINAIAASGGGAGLGSNTTKTFLAEGETGDLIVFEAKFNNDWSGLLLAQPVDFYENDTSVPFWDAGQLIPAGPERNIFTTNLVGGVAGAEAFTSCSGDLAAALNKDADGVVDNLCAERLNWLRGDGRVTGATWSGYDAASGTATATFTVADHGFLVGDVVTISDIAVSDVSPPTPGYDGTVTIIAVTPDTFAALMPSSALGLGTYQEGGRARYAMFRDRPNSVLGDIINSDPVYSADDDFGYGDGASAVDGKDDYAAFLAAKEFRPPMLYVGANDGMLHGFRADTGNSNSGVEQFAYVPNAVYDNLSALTDPGYTHKFYVDGPLSVRDAFLGGWGTYLVGGLGAGGKSVFALDVTDPENFLVNDVLWEFTDPDDDLGLTFGRPQIAAVTASEWAAIFGNGYNIGDPDIDGDDQAYLFVVNLETGVQIAKIATNLDISNGLSTPYLYDSDGDRIIEVVYAGDLQGNLWKFVNSSGIWTLGNAGNPLFTARNDVGDVQPITSEPKVAEHPDGGVLVYFGTGSYLSTDDLTNDDVQSFYAIWDNGEADQGTATRADLQGYSILTQQLAFGLTVRTTSEGTVDWSVQKGWYLDLPDTPNVPSERIISTPLVLEFDDPDVPDRILFVSIIPAADPCSRGGTTWLMELDLISGGRTATSVFDFTDDGVFDTQDTVTVGGEQRTISGIALDPRYGIAGVPLILSEGDGSGNDSGNLKKLFSGTTGVSGEGGIPRQRGEKPGKAGLPDVERIYWRQTL